MISRTYINVECDCICHENHPLSYKEERYKKALTMILRSEYALFGWNCSARIASDALNNDNELEQSCSTPIPERDCKEFRKENPAYETCEFNRQLGETSRSEGRLAYIYQGNMFKDSQEGRTHYQNDGCGEPAHNEAVKSTHKEPQSTHSWQEDLASKFFVYRLGGKHPDHVGAHYDLIAYVEKLIQQAKEEGYNAGIDAINNAEIYDNESLTNAIGEARREKAV